MFIALYMFEMICVVWFKFLIKICTISCMQIEICEGTFGGQCILATLLTLNIKKYCYSYLNGLADLWCLRGRCLPIDLVTIAVVSRSVI